MDPSQPWHEQPEPSPAPNGARASNREQAPDRRPGAERARQWRLRTKSLALTRRPLVMGIVNVTPDSFSDGGRFFSPADAVDHALRLEDEGADILDIGGESTRPFADPVPEEEELRRVGPVFAALAGRTSIPLSIDSWKAPVAEEALAAGAEIINDVTAFTGDPRMAEVAVRSGAGLCAMHMQGTPQTMQLNPSYEDIVAEILDYLRQRLGALTARGVEPGRLALDPGVGFGKTHAHNLTLLGGSWRFHELGCPLLVGASRKGFMGHVLGDKQADRTAAGVGVALALAAQGVQILRVHDVRAVREALLLFEAAGGLEHLAPDSTV